MQVQTASNALPPARPQPAENAGSGDAFAQLLARQPEVEPESENAHDAAPNASTGTRPDEARAAKARQGGARTPAPKATQAEGSARAAKDGAQDGVEAKARSSEEERRADAPTPAMDPALAQWLTQLPRPQAETEVAAPTTLLPGHAPAPNTGQGTAAGADATLDDHVDAGAALQAADARGTATARATAQRHGESAERAAPGRVDDSTPRGAEDDAGPVATTARAGSDSAFMLPAGPEPAAAAAAANASAGSGSVTSAEAPVAASVPVPMESPDFAEAFGVQVSLLARDGVQEAELHLNPAEMGPVSVQIVLDGERARIDFGAQAAATRAAIEASLPELAAALRDAGLTLAGGGVSQHGAGRGDDARQGEAGARGDTRERAAAADTPAARPSWRGRVSAGGVDLYA